MSADPWGIVLVPTEKGRALTAPHRASLPLIPRVLGVCATRSAQPPVVVWYEVGPPNGLILWWCGALVPEGIDRLHRVMQHEQWSRYPTIDAVLQMARQAEYDGLCRLVLLDLVDGAVRERAP